MSSKFEEKLASSEQKYLKKNEDVHEDLGGKTDALLESGTILAGGDPPEKYKEKKAPLRQRLKDFRQNQKQGGTFFANKDRMTANRERKEREDGVNQHRGSGLFGGSGAHSTAGGPQGQRQPAAGQGQPVPGQGQPGGSQQINITPNMRTEWSTMAPQLKQAYGDNIQTWAKIKQFEQQYNPQK